MYMYMYSVCDLHVLMLLISCCGMLQARDSLKDSVAKGMDRGGGSVMDRLSPQPARSPVRSPVPASSPMAVTNLIANR